MRTIMTFTSLSKQNAMIIMTILSLLMVSLLSGCGIRGSLKTPPPLFGGDAKVDPERVPTGDFDSDEDDDFDDLDQDPLADL
jgi:predicted small lipoprotein YifL